VISVRAYDEVYLQPIKKAQGNVFFYVREALPGVNEKWFINQYMRSGLRAKLDHANPKFAAMPPEELIKYFIDDECNGEYERGGEWWGMLPMWAGMIYALYQWYYNVPSWQLINELTLDDMERIYPALHTVGFDAAIDKIHTVVLQRQ
jgi:hypothetical protein